MTVQDARQLSPVASYIAGCSAGSAGIVTGFPFDTVKVRLQNQQIGHGTSWGTFKGILRHQGVRGLFTGLSPQLVGGALECGVNYAVYNESLSYLSRDWHAPSALSVPLAGGAAGFFLSIILSPAELVKCRMQAADARLAFKTPRDCLRHLFQTEGLRGLARGFSGTLAREIPGNAIYFSTYTALRSCIPGKPPATRSGEGCSSAPASAPTLLQRLANASSMVLAGGAAGTVMWALVLPMDVAKTRMQVALPGSRRNLSLPATLRALRREGKLYTGLAPTLVRAFPANAAQWVVWELVAGLLEGH
uniref:Uncharacterized protein n=1 Tax=Auxenochlorella protothecoides TaxID=3075 RepID=A0A1D1ZPJ2_AUXPR